MTKYKRSSKSLGTKNCLLMGWIIVMLFGVGETWTFTWAEEPLSATGQVMKQINRINNLRKQHQYQQKKIQNLVDRYKSLKQDLGNAENKVEKNRLEEKLKKVISDIVKVYPQTTNERNVFGVSTDVDIEYVERVTKVQNELFKIKMEQEVDKLTRLSVVMSDKHKENLKEQEILQQKARKETEKLERLIELRKQFIELRKQLQSTGSSKEETEKLERFKELRKQYLELKKQLQSTGSSEERD